MTDNRRISNRIALAMMGLAAVATIPAWGADPLSDRGSVRGARMSTPIRLADAKPSESDPLAALNGEWYSSGFGLGIKIQGGQGVATNADQVGHKVGDVVLKLTATGTNTFTGEIFMEAVRGKLDWLPAKAAIYGEELRVGVPDRRQAFFKRGSAPKQSEAYPSGARFMIGDCAPYTFVVVTAAPGIDFMTLPQSGQFAFNDAPAPLNKVLAEAEEFAVKTCSANAVRTGYPLYFHLKPLPPLPLTIKDIDATAEAVARIKAGSASWSNKALFAANEAKKAATNAATANAAASAASARAEKSKRDRAAFAAKFGAVELDKMAPLYANPFGLEGKAILVRGRFAEMEDRTTGVFSALAHGMSDTAGTIYVTDFPATAFDQADSLIAVRVVGQTKDKDALGMKHPMVKFLGKLNCPQSPAEPFPACP